MTPAAKTNPHRPLRRLSVTSIATLRIAVLAALLFSTAASAASFTGHYRYVGSPTLYSDAKLQADLAACDRINGVQHATPSKSYQSCMRQQGWKFLYETRDKETASDAASSNVKLQAGHYIDHDNGMDCQNFGDAAVCTPPDGTVHYFDPDQGLNCTRTGIVSICSSM
jgi:hypothetical protein